MRKGMITLLCVAGLMLWGVTTASATDINWELLMDAGVAGATPQSQGGNWIVIPGSGGANGCNFTTGTNCSTGATPGTGSYSFSAIEYTNPSWYSCLDLASGATAGAPCVCAEPASQPCTSDADCTSSGSCAGAGDCCPGPLNSCKLCEDDPLGPDSFSFFGVDGSLGPAPNLITCQDATGNDFHVTKYHVASSESIAGSGGACLKLNMAGAPFIGAPCGVGAITSGSLDVDVYVGGCLLKGTTINNIAYTGRVYDTAVGAPAGACGYTTGQIDTMLGQASSAGGDYMMVLCGATTVPTDSKTACLRGADVDFVVVSWTADDASICDDTGGTCP